MLQAHDSLREITKAWSVLKFDTLGIIHDTVDSLKKNGYEVKKYEDKNVLFKNQSLIDTGVLLHRQGNWCLAEKYWNLISDEIDQLSRTNDIRLNHGISSGNAAIAQLAQGKYALGADNLLNAYKEDEKFLSEKNIKTKDHKEAFYNSLLYRQFEKFAWETIDLGLISRSSISKNTYKQDDFQLFVEKLNFADRAQFFSLISELKEVLRLETESSGMYLRVKKLQVTVHLCTFIEGYLKKKYKSQILRDNVGLSFQQILRYVLNKNGYKVCISNTDSLTSTSLTELQRKVVRYTKKKNVYEKCALTTLLIRNYSAHNYPSKGNKEFYKRLNEYLARIFILLKWL
jgi:hypothetical protein